MTTAKQKLEIIFSSILVACFVGLVILLVYKVMERRRRKSPTWREIFHDWGKTSVQYDASSNTFSSRRDRTRSPAKYYGEERQGSSYNAEKDRDDKFFKLQEEKAKFLKERKKDVYPPKYQDKSYEFFKNQTKNLLEYGFKHNPLSPHLTLFLEPCSWIDNEKIDFSRRIQIREMNDEQFVYLATSKDYPEYVRRFNETYDQIESFINREDEKKEQLANPRRQDYEIRDPNANFLFKLIGFDKRTIKSKSNFSYD